MAVHWLNQFWKRLTEPTPGVRRIIDRPIIRHTVTAENSLDGFTPRAQQALALARKEAYRLNHSFLGTEHVLLGIIKLGQGTAVNVLRRMGLDMETVRHNVEENVGTGPDQKLFGSIPYTPRAKKVIALARKEAKQLSHTYVGTEHLLLGLLREGEGVGAKVLASFGAELGKTRNEILMELDPNYTPDAASSHTAGDKDEPTSAWDMSTDPMDHLTPRAQEAFRLACEEAKNFKHYLAGTEHLLLGLIRLGQGVAVKVLSKAGLNLETVRCEVKKTEIPGSDENASGIIGFSEGVKTVMTIAQREAKQLSHTYIGTEHLLLGLMQAHEEVAPKIMRNLGVDLQRMRHEILRELDPNSGPSPKEKTATETADKMWQRWVSRFPKPDPLDLSKRYDVYCIQHGESVVYRNVLIKSVKGLFASYGADSSSLYIELEPPDGNAIFLPKHSVFKFCTPGAAASGEPVP